MDFYYPNFINDMWRIMGEIYFEDKSHFITGKRFDKDALTEFCSAKGIALYDTAVEIRRLRDNASDKFLEIVTQADIPALLDKIPLCGTVAATGTKAAEALAEELGCGVPRMGESVNLTLPAAHSNPNGERLNRTLRVYRMPSTSRAYPLSLERKAEYYRRMLSETGMLSQSFLSE